MKRFMSCRVAGVLFAGLMVAGAHAAESRQPNLLFIMTDQQRFDALSCAGNTVLKTPNLDRIAREGVLFKNAYSANPICVPARATLLTGLSSANVRVSSNSDYTSQDVPDVPTFDSVLKENGYAAEYHGKWHTPYQFAELYDNPVYPIGNNHGLPHIVSVYKKWLISKGVKPKEPGPGELLSGRNQRPYKPIKLDVSYEEADSLSSDEKMKMRASQETQYGCIDLPPRVSYTAYAAEETLNAIDRMKDGPFTLTCSFDPPHPPMVVQEPYYSMYPPETIPIPDNLRDPMTGSPYRSRWMDDEPYRDEEQIPKMRSIYYGMVAEIDDWVGEILNKLDELGLADNTLIVFTSDHGELLGDHGMHSKSMFYEGAVHIPLLMRFPGRIQPGTVVEQPVSHLDVMPTILDYLGQEVPESNGISLRPMVEGKTVEHDVVAFSSGRSHPNYMIRVGALKLLMAKDDKSDNIDALYDLEADPLELRNLIVEPISPEKNRADAEMMKERLVDWLKKHEPQSAEGVEHRKLF